MNKDIFSILDIIKAENNGIKVIYISAYQDFLITTKDINAFFRISNVEDIINEEKSVKIVMKNSVTTLIKDLKEA